MNQGLSVAIVVGHLNAISIDAFAVKDKGWPRTCHDTQNGKKDADADAGGRGELQTPDSMPSTADTVLSPHRDHDASVNCSAADQGTPSTSILGPSIDVHKVQVPDGKRCGGGGPKGGLKSAINLGPPSRPAPPSPRNLHNFPCKSEPLCTLAAPNVDSTLQAHRDSGCAQFNEALPEVSESIDMQSLRNTSFSYLSLDTAVLDKSDLQGQTSPSLDLRTPICSPLEKEEQVLPTNTHPSHQHDEKERPARAPASSRLDSHHVAIAQKMVSRADMDRAQREIDSLRRDVERLDSHIRKSVPETDKGDTDIQQECNQQLEEDKSRDAGSHYKILASSRSMAVQGKCGEVCTTCDSCSPAKEAADFTGTSTPPEEPTAVLESIVSAPLPCASSVCIASAGSVEAAPQQASAASLGASPPVCAQATKPPLSPRVRASCARDGRGRILHNLSRGQKLQSPRPPIPSAHSQEHAAPDHSAGPPQVYLQFHPREPIPGTNQGEPSQPMSMVNRSPHRHSLTSARQMSSVFQSNAVNGSPSAGECDRESSSLTSARAVCRAGDSTVSARAVARAQHVLSCAVPLDSVVIAGFADASPRASLSCSPQVCCATIPCLGPAIS